MSLPKSFGIAKGWPVGGGQASITLAALTGTFTLAEDAIAGATAGTLSGRTIGSTLSLLDDAGGHVGISGTTIVRGATALDYETASSHSFTVRETLAGATNSPRDTVFTLSVTDVTETTLNALTGTFTLAEDAIAGAVAGALSGRTSGSTLSLIDDAGGRVALSGTSIVRGLVALDYATATSHSFTVRETLAGATNTPRDTTLTLNVTEAGSLPAYAVPPTLPIDPTVEYHAHTSTITTGNYDETVYGYMTVESALAYLYLTTTPPAGFDIGVRLDCVSDNSVQDGIFVQKFISGTPATAGAKYLLTNGTDSIGSLGTPATWRAYSTDLVLQLNDLRSGAAHMTSVLSDGTDVKYGSAPILAEDADGIKNIVFGVRDAGGTFLANTTRTGNDSHNMVWFIVAKVQNVKHDIFLSLGVEGGSFHNRGWMSAPGGSSGLQYVEAPYLDFCDAHWVHNGTGSTASPVGIPSNANLLQANCNLSLYGMATVTTAASGNLNGTGNSVQARHVVHDQAANMPAQSISRANNMTGWVFGRYPGAAHTSPQSARWGRYALYYAVGYLADELAQGTTGATRATTVFANCAAIEAAIRSHFGMQGFTDSILIVGDSREEINNVTGVTPAVLIADAANKTTRVINYARGGADIADHYMYSFGRGGPLSDQAKIGGSSYGHDWVGYMLGVNDAGSAWPINNAALYIGAPHSTARGEEMYNGNGNEALYDASFVGSLSASTVTYESGLVGKILTRGMLRGGTLAEGTYLGAQTTGIGSTPGTAGAWATIQGAAAQASGTSFTVTFGNQFRYAKQVLTRNFGLFVAEEMALGAATPWDDAQVAARARQAGNMVTDLAAWDSSKNGRTTVFDMAATYGYSPDTAKQPLGTDSYPYASSNGYYVGLHPKDKGSRVIAKGWIEQLQLLGLAPAAGAPTLNALSGSFSLAENASSGAVAGALSGRTSGSTLSLTDDAGGRVAISGTNIVRGATGLDYETATSHSFTVRETLSGATNTPRDTTLTLNVTDVADGPTLNALSGTFTLAEDATAGAVAGALSGKTASSTLSLTDDAGGRVALSGTNVVRGATALDYETATSHSFTVRETLAGSPNSPRDTALTLNVTDVAEGGGGTDALLLEAGAGYLLIEGGTDKILLE